MYKKRFSLNFALISFSVISILIHMNRDQYTILCCVAHIDFSLESHHHANICMGYPVYCNLVAKFLTNISNYV